jgi:DNA-binding response OmpR family regulator
MLRKKKQKAKKILVVDDDYMAKPFDPERLIEKVRKLI